MSKAKEYLEKQGFNYDHFTTLTSTGISPDYENIIRFATDFANEQTQSLIDEIKELKKRSFIEKVARGNIEMTPAHLLEYAELKESNTWVSVEEPPQKGGYYQVYNKYSGLPVVVYYGSRYPFSPMPPEKEMSFWEGNKKMSFRHKKFYRPLPTPPKQ